MILGQRPFFFIIKFVFREKPEFYLFYYHSILKDRVLFEQTGPSIEIYVNVVKKTWLYFVQKYLKWKK